MKVTSTKLIRKAGMTLLELTVVILVLLSLIAILFIGARAWKKGSDRSASILTIRNVQQAVRSYANMNNVPEGTMIPYTDLYGTGKFMQTDPSLIAHPGGAGLTYTYPTAGAVPGVGVLFLTVTGSATSDSTPGTYYMPTAGTYNDW